MSDWADEKARKLGEHFDRYGWLHGDEKKIAALLRSVRAEADQRAERAEQALAKCKQSNGDTLRKLVEMGKRSLEIRNGQLAEQLEKAESRIADAYLAGQRRMQEKAAEAADPVDDVLAAVIRALEPEPMEEGK